MASVTVRMLMPHRGIQIGERANYPAHVADDLVERGVASLVDPSEVEPAALPPRHDSTTPVEVTMLAALAGLQVGENALFPPRRAAQLVKDGSAMMAAAPPAPDAATPETKPAEKADKQSRPKARTRKPAATRQR
ncbi:MAG TPA: hypothetical protein VM285_07470 [Polyangia bacterium]|nr:hypothetical protein [Thermoleophilia bacterium]HUT77508.1 hypothetical protein [Polyangia bacterium]